MAVVTSVMVDRAKHKYGARIEPDELVNDPSLVVAKAIAWLRAP